MPGIHCIKLLGMSRSSNSHNGKGKCSVSAHHAAEKQNQLINQKKPTQTDLISSLDAGQNHLKRLLSGTKC